jgi:hypothetical protein
MVNRPANNCPARYSRFADTIPGAQSITVLPK